MSYANEKSFNKATSAGFIIALGVVYGDIGTSPLYTMQSIVTGQGGLQNISTDFIFRQKWFLLSKFRRFIGL